MKLQKLQPAPNASKRCGMLKLASLNKKFFYISKPVICPFCKQTEYSSVHAVSVAIKKTFSVITVVISKLFCVRHLIQV